MDTVSSRVKQAAHSIVASLASERAFYVIAGLLLLQALWFIATARYPMAFDEDFHFGLIKLHAMQWLPYFTSQPAHAEVFGAVARDPSYFYHYLMSFPYRLVSAITSDQTAQIIVLRFINVGLALGSLVLFRRLLFRLGASRPMSHAILLLFILVPIVPFLAAHINYDNLSILLTLWCFLAAFSWIDALRQNRIDVTPTVYLLAALALNCLVKYTFLPIGIVIAGAMLIAVCRQRVHWQALRKHFLATVRAAGIVHVISLVLLLAVSTFLFTERFGINMVRYHEPNPDCSQVLPVSSCIQYGPWARDYTYAQQKPAGYKPSKLAYPWQWLYGMWQRSFFAISDTYDTQPPLPLPGRTVVILAIAGSVLLLVYWRKVFSKNRYRQLVLASLIVYALTLFAQTFKSYLYTAQPVAINGRYLVLFMPVMFLLVGLAFRQLLVKKEVAKVGAVAIVLLLFLQGGGILTFIARSKDSWFWPNPTVINVNSKTRAILQTLVIGAKD